MLEELDKTLNEGQEGVVDPKGEKEENLPEVTVTEPTDEDLEDNVESTRANPFADYGDVEDDYDEEPVEDVQEQEIPDKKVQTPEENSAFAKLRRKEEELAKREAVIREAELQRQIENEMLTPEKIWEYADEHSITEEMARKFLTQEAQLRAQQQKIQLEARNTQLQIQKERLKDDPLYKHFGGEVEDIVRNNPDVDVNVALDYVVGKNRAKLTELLSSKAKSEVIANQQDKMRRRSMKGTESQSAYKPALSSFVSKFNEYAGIDSREVEKHVSQKKKTMKGMM